jgi:hypothetical protein
VTTTLPNRNPQNNFLFTLASCWEHYFTLKRKTSFGLPLLVIIPINLCQPNPQDEINRWCKVYYKNLIALQLVKKFPAFMDPECPLSIQKACHWTLS